MPADRSLAAAAAKRSLLCCSADNPDAVRDKLVPAFLRGIASHHAGCLPAWKSLVERCFQKGLLKLVYATGALACHVITTCYDNHHDKRVWVFDLTAR
jgi:superfamily II RNA helicase